MMVELNNSILRFNKMVFEQQMDISRANTKITPGQILKCKSAKFDTAFNSSLTSKGRPNRDYNKTSLA